MHYYLGVDCGSVSVKAVIIDQNKKVVESYYTRNHGLIETTQELMSYLGKNTYDLLDSCQIKGVGITGSGKEFVSLLVGGDIVESEVIAHYVATMDSYPDAKTIFDIGGEDCIVNFNMNRDCGGGTGAMIESIAVRMGVELDEIGTVALFSENPVTIPSKCGIFTQSAVVSKLNRGVSKEDILMGVCKGLIGNYFTMLAKGKVLQPPYVFQGATANNKALVKCFEDELNHKVVVPEHPELMGALGVALLAMEQVPSTQLSNFKGFHVSESVYNAYMFYGNGCTNHCEITQITESNGELLGYIGNRCERCVKDETNRNTR
jgi:predicted CoA-substrate-specific enzyme activase